jgi:isocitrate dehydrogenase (NAD+)
MSATLDVTLIPGDGIGPAITDAAVQVLEAAGATFTWDRQLAGMAAVKAHGDPIPEATLESIKRTKLALKGPLETPVGKGFRSINVALRKEFDLYANLRPAKTILPHGRFDSVDVVLVRENTEGLYVGVEHYVKIGDDPHAVAQSVAIISRVGAERIVRYAFEYALKHGRRKVTIVHKANILKYSQGLFLEVGRQVAREYEGRVASDDKIVDACAMELVMRPEKFDVIVTTNLFGDILSDLTSGLVGGLGLTPGANIGYDCGIFEAVHGTAPDIAGQGIANPTAVMLAGCQLLDHVGEGVRASRIRTAIEAVLREGKMVTRDVGGSASTEQYTDAVIARLQQG